MPGKNRNARNTRRSYDTSPQPQLPTPLPEQLDPIVNEGQGELIDFGIEPPRFHINEPDTEDHESVYRSPPFMEAHLPSVDDLSPPSPPPLPIPPPRSLPHRYEAEPSSASRGHIRSPSLPRSQTTLESLSRTLRTYVPSSIHIPVPTAAPSPPLVSRPVSFGRFSAARFNSGNEQRNRHDSEELSGWRLDEGRAADGILTYPRMSHDTDQTEPIIWAHWDNLKDRRLLIIAYASGLQMWDCTDLNSVAEVLNLNFAQQDWADGILTVVHAAILPSPRLDPFAQDRPLLALLLRRTEGHTESTCLLYSLHSHQVVKRLSIPGDAITFQSNQHFIVFSTTAPLALRILSSSTFQNLYIIPSTSLVSLNPGPIQPNTDPGDTHNRSHPVFALDHRLLAYASPPSITSLDKANVRVKPTPSNISPSFKFALGKGMGMTQADVGRAAMKVGGSMWGGMKFLGGMAYEAAKTRVAVPEEGNRFYSRSAPAGNSDVGWDEQEGEGEQPEEGSADSSAEMANLHSGSYVTVVDLDIGGNAPKKVAEFVGSRSQAIADLGFSGDGTQMLVVPRDGHVLKVFRLRLGSGLGVSSVESEVERVYDLRRGRTSADVEGVDWSIDGRWVAVGTRNRTVHVFAVNPYGGKPDQKSHLEGRVRNHLTSTELSAIVRLRMSTQPMLKVPLAFTFISPSELSMPPSLLPLSVAPPVPDPTTSPPLSPRRSQRPANYQDLLLFDPTDGTLYLRRVTVDTRPEEHGMSVAASVSALAATSISLPGMGDGGGGSGNNSNHNSKPSSSPSTRPANTRVSGLTQMMEPALVELVGRESVVAKWSLQRRKDWEEIRQPFLEDSGMSLGLNEDWLSYAELSTCSKSSRVLPRSIYLSHQFSFHTLGEDYHALIRRYQLDIPGSHIDVRKGVEVSAFSRGGEGELFVEGFSSPVRHVASSFDEPLASALAGGLEHPNPTAIIPMFPNGTPGSKPKSFRDSIPIRRMAGIGDGMSEGFGRIRRGVSKARSPQMLARSDSSLSGVVPLEFDEEDEDFAVRETLDVPDRGRGTSTSHTRTVSRGGASADSGPLIQTPSPGTRPFEGEVVDVSEEDGHWRGWEEGDREAVEEAERFDDISVVGFLDEEQTTMMQAAAQKRAGKPRRRK